MMDSYLPIVKMRIPTEFQPLFTSDIFPTSDTNVMHNNGLRFIHR